MDFDLTTNVLQNGLQKEKNMRLKKSQINKIFKKIIGPHLNKETLG